MIIGIIIAVVLIILFYMSSRTENQPGKPRKNTTATSNKSFPKFQNDMTVDQIVQSVQSITDLRSLEKKIERLYNSYRNNIEDLTDKFEKAFEKAANKTYKYQFIPVDEINVPLEVLKHSYKVVDSKKDIFQGIENVAQYGQWVEFDGTSLLQNSLNDIIEPKPEYWKAILKLKGIIESPDGREAKIKLIKKHIKANSSLEDIIDLPDFDYPEEVEEFINEILPPLAQV